MTGDTQEPHQPGGNPAAIVVVGNDPALVA